MCHKLEFIELPSGNLKYTTSKGSDIIVYRKKSNGMYDWFISDGVPQAPWSNPDVKFLLGEDIHGFWDTYSALDDIMQFLKDTTGTTYSWGILPEPSRTL